MEANDLNDPFLVLGVPRGAPEDVIDRAWKRKRNALQGASERGDADAERALKSINQARLQIADASRAIAPAPQPHQGVVVPTKTTTPGIVVINHKVGKWTRTVGLSVPWLLVLRGGECTLTLANALTITFAMPENATEGTRWTVLEPAGREITVTLERIRLHAFYRSARPDVKMTVRMPYARWYRGGDLSIHGPWGDVVWAVAPCHAGPVVVPGHGHRPNGNLVINIEIQHPAPGNIVLAEALAFAQQDDVLEFVRPR